MIKKSWYTLLICLLVFCCLSGVFCQDVKAATVKSAQKKLSDMYYSQLSSQEKYVYRLLSRTNLRKQSTIRWNVSLSFKVSKEEYETQAWTERDDVYALLAEAISAYYAYRLDYMDDCYWLSEDFSYYYRYSHVQTSNSDDVTIHIKGMTIILMPAYDTVLEDDVLVQKAIGKLYTYIAANRKDSSRQETILTMASVMVRTMNYDNPTPALGYTPASVLLNKYGKSGNSEAYARVLCILCKKFKIPVVYVQSETHTYNYVQMEDGAWYGVDLTWADKGKGLNKVWVLYGSAVAAKYDFSTQHDALNFKNGISLCAINLSKRSYKK